MRVSREIYLEWPLYCDGGGLRELANRFRFFNNLVGSGGLREETD